MSKGDTFEGQHSSGWILLVTLCVHYSFIYLSVLATHILSTGCMLGRGTDARGGKMNKAKSWFSHCSSLYWEDRTDEEV